MKFTLRLSVVTLCTAVLFHCTGKSNIQIATPGNNDIVAAPEAMSVQAQVLADTGATLSIGSSLQLTVPAGALNADTLITVDKKSVAPAQGILVPVARSIELGAHGTQFNKSVALNVCYDPQTLAAKNLYEETLAVYYVDEQTGEYGSVGGSVNKSTHCVSANIEHFSTYLVAAQNLSVNLPAASQLPQISVTYQPGTPIAGLPVKVRAAITDFKLTPVSNGSGVQVGFGQIATVRYCYYAAPAVTCSGGLQNLAPDYDDDTNNFYSFTIPGSQVTTQGFTVLYEVYNSLGFKRTHTVSYTPTRTATGIQFTANAVVNLAAGFKRSYTVQGLSNPGTPQNIPVDSFTLNGGIGTAALASVSVIRVTGTTANAQAMRTGSLTVTAGAYSITSADINVHAGLLDHIALLSPTGVVLGGTISINANATYDFDVLGYDAFGNTSNVLPQFVIASIPPSMNGGSISPTGLYTAPAAAASPTATLIATLNGVQDSILINVVLPTVGLPPAMTVLSNVPAIGIKVLNNGTDTFGIWVDESSPTSSVVLSRWNGTNWVILGNCTSTTTILNFDTVLVNGLPFIGYTADEYGYQTRNIRFYQWNGTQLVLAPSPLRNSGVDSGQVALATSGNLAYAAWQEHSSGYPTYASAWDGSTWTTLGGQINAAYGSYYPQIAVFQGQPLVMTNEDGNVLKDVYLKAYDGFGNWNTLVGPIPTGANGALSLQMRVSGNNIYTAWIDWDATAHTYKVMVGQSDGVTFSILGNTYVNADPSVNTIATSLEIFNGIPYVGYTVQGVSPTQVYAHYFSGGVWNLVGGTSLNVNPAENAYGPIFSNVNGVKYVGFAESPGGLISNTTSTYLRILP